MKYILITRTFQKQLKEFRRHFSEQDLVADISHFIRTGGGKHGHVNSSHDFGTKPWLMSSLFLPDGRHREVRLLLPEHP